MRSHVTGQNWARLPALRSRAPVQNYSLRPLLAISYYLLAIINELLASNYVGGIVLRALML